LYRNRGCRLLDYNEYFNKEVEELKKQNELLKFKEKNENETK
jgi:hypothetical protein